MAVSWKLNLKWKPPIDNTIDFLVRIEKDRIYIDKEKDIYIEKDKVKYKDSLFIYRLALFNRNDKKCPTH